MANLVLWSESLNTAPWAKLANTFVTSDAGTDPLGGSTADRLNFGTGSGTTISQRIDGLTVGVDYTFSLYRKNFGTTTGNLWLRVLTTALGTFTGINGVVVNAAPDWVRVSYTFTCPATSIAIALDNSGTAVDELIWGVQLNAGSAPDTYVKTEGSQALDPTGSTLVADAGAFSATGIDAALLVARAISSEPGSHTAAGQDANLVVARGIQADTGSFAVDGIASGLIAARVLAAEPGAFTLSGQAAGTLSTRVLTASAGSVALSGSPAGLTVARALSAAAGSVALTGYDAALTKTAVGAFVLTADPGVYSLTGQSAGQLSTYRLAAETGALLVSGANAALTYDDGTTPPSVPQRDGDAGPAPRERRWVRGAPIQWRGVKDVVRETKRVAKAPAEAVEAIAEDLRADLPLFRERLPEPVYEGLAQAASIMEQAAQARQQAERSALIASALYQMREMARLQAEIEDEEDTIALLLAA